MIFWAMEKEDGKIFHELLGLETDKYMIKFESCIVLGYSQVVNVKGTKKILLPKREKNG